MTFSERLNAFIESLSRGSGALVTRVTKSWKAVTIIAVLLVGSSIAFLVYALQEPHPPKPVETPVEEPVATSTVNLLERGLDGMLVDASSTHLMPIGVMVENSVDAWPLQGPAKANLVFEAPVEGSITRFFLVFDASSTVSEIGPVRSARPYFVDWADGLDAMYTHVGGSPEALDKIVAIKGFRDLNEFWNGWAFWRSAKRIAPHNVLTSMELLRKAAERKTFVTGSFTPWRYMDPATSTEPVVGEADKPVDVEKIVVPYEGMYAAEWRYDAEADEYIRYRAGSILKDADGTPTRVKNVVVMLSDMQVLDDVGRLKIRTTGSGKAWVFSAGGKREATWSRTTGEHIRFEGIDGSDVFFARGKTWISTVTSQAAFDKVLK